MTWRDRLRRVTLADGRRLIGASFRGVPFFVESSDRGGGRRVSVQELYSADDPAVQDLGRSTRRFRIEGYVIGDDYLAQRDALLDALESQAGPGDLVHPGYGQLRAQVDDVGVRESTRDGGMAMVSIGLVQVAEGRSPAEEVDLAAAAKSAASAARDASEASFAETYDVDGAPQYALDSLESELDAASAALGDALAPLATGAQEAALVTQQADIIGAKASQLVASPVDLFAALAAALAAAAQSAADRPRDVVLALAAAYEKIGLSSAPLVATPEREREAVNREAMIALLRRAMAVEAARVLVDVRHATLNDAVSDAAAVAGLLAQEESTADSTAFPALALLRARLRRAVPGDRVLAQLQQIELRVSVPSLVLSYRRYGTVAREAEIVERNGIANPTFVAGVVEVLSDV